ncbi:MAG: Serine/threonine protein kinase [Candidatus Doudnabacteria bacterium]|nr:Serine/threonine protein kinase [Candidatus Doudnabacteria bacterium]
MKSRTRYGLIVTGIVAFIVLSPFIYLFVRGEKYDFKNHRFITTGTLSVATQPKGAHIYLNGVDTATSSTNIRFITPGDYNVQLKKDQYFDWSKRLNIRGQYVTYANTIVSGITLFFSTPKKTNLASNIINFFAGTEKLLYLTKDKAFIADVGSPEKTDQINLPTSLDKLDIISSPDENYFLLRSASTPFYGVIDVRAKTLIDITSLTTSEQILFSNNNELFQIQSGTVYKIDWRLQQKNVILKNILTFYPTAQNIYYISGQTLAVAQAPNYNPVVLLTNLPTFQTASLYLSDRNQLFIVGDGSLYSLDQGLRRISDYVNSVKFDNKNEKLVYSTNNEIDIYDLLNNSNYLVTRSSASIQNPIAVVDLGWVFMQSDNRLQSIEIDNRDHQNNYTFANISDTSKYFVDNVAKYLFLLSNGELSRMQIR